MWLSLIGVLFPSVSKILDKIIPDANDRLEAKKEVLYTVETVLKEKGDLIKEEIRGADKFQRLWRPIVGWSFSIMAIFIIFFTSIFRPIFYFLTGIELPELLVQPELWNATFFCLGGYMTLRSIERIVRWLKI